MLPELRYRQLNDLTELHSQLLRQLTEKYLASVCQAMNMKASFCAGDYLFLASVGSHMPKGISMAEVARIMNIHPSTATREVNHLLKHVLITKTVVPEDERRYRILLTEKGSEFLKQMNGYRLSLHDGMQWRAAGTLD